MKREPIECINSPFGITLFFLDQVIFGVGLPLAAHSIRTEPPFFTCKWPPELIWCILGGTIKLKFMVIITFRQTTITADATPHPSIDDHIILFAYKLSLFQRNWYYHKIYEILFACCSFLPAPLYSFYFWFSFLYFVSCCRFNGVPRDGLLFLLNFCHFKRRRPLW